MCEKQAAWQGLGRHVRPSEFSGLNCPSETRTRRSGDSRNDLPKVTAQILGTGGISPGTPNPAASSRVPGAAALGQGRMPSSGLHGAHREGLGGPQGAGCGQGASQGPWPPREASFSFPLDWAGGPQPAPGVEPKTMVAAASRFLGSRFQDGQLHTWWGLRLHSSQSDGGGQQKGKWLGGRPGGGGLGEKREKGNRPLALFSVNSLTRVAPSRVPRAWSTAAIETNRHGCAHTLAHAQQPHTRTHTPLLTFRPSVENTACVNSVKRSAQQELGRMSFCREAGPLGFFSIFPPIPHLDHDIRKSG